MAEVLIVDDERVIREGLRVTLSGEGYDVRTARDGDDALAKIAEKRPDLVLLDVMMPKMNGFRCCEEIRKLDAFLPIVFLSAKEAEADRIRAAGLEADDYVFKSASEALILASVRRAILRAKTHTAKCGPGLSENLRLGSVIVSLHTFAVVADGREVARLTKTEADILRCLFAAQGAPVSPDDLITDLRGNGFACEDSMLYSHIANLRRKLGKEGDLVANKHGVGYFLRY